MADLVHDREHGGRARVRRALDPNGPAAMAVVGAVALAGTAGVVTAPSWLGRPLLPTAEEDPVAQLLGPAARALPLWMGGAVVVGLLAPGWLLVSGAAPTEVRRPLAACAGLLVVQAGLETVIARSSSPHGVYLTGAAFTGYRLLQLAAGWRAARGDVSSRTGTVLLAGLTFWSVNLGVVGALSRRVLSRAWTAPAHDPSGRRR